LCWTPQHDVHTATSRARGVTANSSSVPEFPADRRAGWGSSVSALGGRALALLVAAAAAFGCGSSASDVNGSASGGASQGGSASGGTTGVGQGGSAGSAGGAGAGGMQNRGTGGIGEMCLICGGAGFGGGVGHAGSAGGGASGAGAGGGSACGAATCGPNQYCRAACSGIGGAPPDNPSCADLPAACNGVPSCACICGVTASFCTPGAHEVQCGCA